MRTMPANGVAITVGVPVDVLDTIAVGVKLAARCGLGVELGGGVDVRVSVSVTRGVGVQVNVGVTLGVGVIVYVGVAVTQLDAAILGTPPAPGVHTGSRGVGGTWAQPSGCGPSRTSQAPTPRPAAQAPQRRISN